MKADDLGSWLERARLSLAGISENPFLEAALLAASSLGQNKTWILAHPEVVLDSDHRVQLESQLAKLRAGEPLPYILGRQEFYGLEFEVNPAVLIPRPETELLVEQAATWLRAHPTRRRAVDVGTGSGCIAVSLAWTIPDLLVLACDRSWPALKTARANAARHGVDARLSWLQSDLLSACAGPFDLVCANLPYIPREELARLAVAAHEPLQALDGGVDGLDLIRRLVFDARRWLEPGGLLLLEIEAGQGDSALEQARQAFPTAQLNLLRDLAGLDRLVRIETDPNGT